MITVSLYLNYQMFQYHIQYDFSNRNKKDEEESWSLKKMMILWKQKGQRIGHRPSSGQRSTGTGSDVQILQTNDVILLMT